MIKIAVIGASGAVGREIMKDLEDSDLKDIEIFPFASPKSEGEVLSFRTKSVIIKAFKLEDVRSCDYALMSAGGAFSKEFGHKIVENGGPVLIDNSSAWRMKDGVPLIIPEVNGQSLHSFKGGIIANPNCSMIQLAVCLKPLLTAFGLEFVQVTTFQSVSGSGQKGIKELSSQVEAHMKFLDPTPHVYDHPIAFNVIPYIGSIDASGYCEEEIKIIEELRKVLDRPGLEVMATTARVPVFNGHSESVTVRLGQTATKDEVLKVIRDAKMPVYCTDERTSKFPTPRTMVGYKGVFMSRLRFLNQADRGQWLQFWNLADNLKKGAATNAVQILEYLEKPGARMSSSRLKL
jgi:aspartate-semialdehyde dehydrogenase